MKIGDLEVQEVKVLRLQPDDILVLYTDRFPLSGEEIDHIKINLLDGFGITNKLMIVDRREMDVAILRKETK